MWRETESVQLVHALCCRQSRRRQHPRSDAAFLCNGLGTGGAGILICESWLAADEHSAGSAHNHHAHDWPQVWCELQSIKRCHCAEAEWIDAPKARLWMHSHGLCDLKRRISCTSARLFEVCGTHHLGNMMHVSSPAIEQPSTAMPATVICPSRSGFCVEVQQNDYGWQVQTLETS